MRMAKAHETPNIREKTLQIYNQRKFRSSKFGLHLNLPVGSADARHERFWRVRIARNAWFFHIVSWLRRFVRKARWCEGSAAQDADKICTTPARESDSEAKIVKIWRCRSTFGSWASHIFTTSARESDLEIKIVKIWHAGTAFGSWASQNLHHVCARERFGTQNR